MSSTIVFPKDFKITNITVSPLKVMDSGAKQAYVNYEGRSLMMQVSALTVPYGMSMFDKAGPVKYSVDLSLKGYDGDNLKTKQIYETFNTLDEHIIDLGTKFSKQWFKSELSKDIIRAFYTPTVRFSKDAEGNVKPYPPTLKIQLKQRDGKFETAIYDDKKLPLTDVPLEDILVKGAVISSLIQCTGVWFAGSKFGLSWKAVQIKADEIPASIRGFAFRDEEGAEPVSRVTVAPTPVSTNKFSVLDDEEEEEEEDDVDDEAVMKIAPPVSAPKAALPPQTMDDDADIIEPVAVPKKTGVVTKRKIVAAIKK